MKTQKRTRWKAKLCILVSLAATPCLAAQEGHDAPQSQPKYTLASICGDYGAVATYGANVARALGTESFDGHGNLTGSAIVNQPGSNSTRSITSISLSGTYSVKADGTGKMLLTVTLPDGATATVTG